MDLAHALKVALETGKVQIGLTETLAAAESKKARLLIVAKTCPNVIEGGRVEIRPMAGLAPSAG